MRILLDTCTFLWLALDDPRLSKNARDLFAGTENEVFLSVVSSWEIAVKHSLKRLMLPGSPGELIPAWRERRGVASLPLEEDAALYESRLPRWHNDPFDRMLICQSIVHGLAILTPDPEIVRYPVHTVW